MEVLGSTWATSGPGVCPESGPSQRQTDCAEHWPGVGRWGADLGLGIRPLSSPLPLSLAHPRALGPVTNGPPPQVAQALADSAMGLVHRRDPRPAQWVMNN